MSVSPILALRARAEARAVLFGENQFADLGEATEPLLEYARDAGLIEMLGQRAVELIILDPFKPYIQ